MITGSRHNVLKDKRHIQCVTTSSNTATDHSGALGDVCSLSDAGASCGNKETFVPAGHSSSPLIPLPPSPYNPNQCKCGSPVEVWMHVSFEDGAPVGRLILKEDKVWIEHDVCAVKTETARMDDLFFCKKCYGEAGGRI